METRQTVTITIPKGDYQFTFNMPVGSSWGNAMDAAYDLLNHIGDLARQSIEQSKPVVINKEPEVIEPTVIEGDYNG